MQCKIRRHKVNQFKDEQNNKLGVINLFLLTYQNVKSVVN